MCKPLVSIYNLCLISKKPNVLNFQFKFAPPPRGATGGGGKKIISVYALGQDTGSEQDN